MSNEQDIITFDHSYLVEDPIVSADPKYISFTWLDDEILRLTDSGFFVRGVPIPQDENEAGEVFKAFKDWLASVNGWARIRELEEVIIERTEERDVSRQRIVELEKLLIGPEDDGRKLAPHSSEHIVNLVGELIPPEDAVILGWRLIRAAMRKS